MCLESGGGGGPVSIEVTMRCVWVHVWMLHAMEQEKMGVMWVKLHHRAPVGSPSTCFLGEYNVHPTTFSPAPCA